MTHEIADWVNRSGMILSFVAFWFAAPEFIGDKRLRAWEQALLQRGLLKLPVAAKAMMLITMDCIIGLYFLRWVWSGRGKLADITPVQLATLGIVSATAIFFESIADNILRPVTAKLVSRLTDADVRQHSLFFGAALFTISFVLQFTATFQTSLLHYSFGNAVHNALRSATESLRKGQSWWDYCAYFVLFVFVLLQYFLIKHTNLLRGDRKNNP